MSQVCHGCGGIERKPLSSLVGCGTTPAGGFELNQYSGLRVPAPDLSFVRPNLSFLIEEFERIVLDE
jgi:hypothetical protein